MFDSIRIIKSNNDWNISEGLINNQKILHYYYTKWPDLGVPKPIDSLFEMAQQVMKDRNEFYSSNPGPVVHCLAGQGRTGTFIAAMKLIDDKNENIIEFIKHMRQYRPYMIEKYVQYNALEEIKIKLI